MSELGISDRMISNKGVVGTMCGDVNILASCPGIILIDETYLQERVGIVFFYTCQETEVFLWQIPILPSVRWLMR